MNSSKAKTSYARNRKEKETTLIFKQQFINIILKEFELRKRKSLHYSLRQFARDLNINPMHLSNVLRGTRGISRSKAEEISKTFNLKYEERIHFYRLVSASCGRSKLKRNLAKMGLKNELQRNRYLDLLKQASAAADAETV